jgi:hypothetical protein
MRFRCVSLIGAASGIIACGIGFAAPARAGQGARPLVKAPNGAYPGLTRAKEGRWAGPLRGSGAQHILIEHRYYGLEQVPERVTMEQEGRGQSSTAVGPNATVQGLKGWHVQNGKPEVWKVDGNVIRCVAPGGGFLTTDREYGDFEVSLEYRIPPGGNTGVGIRYPPGGHPSTTGMEIQILDDDAPKHRNLKPSQYNGSIYHLVAPKAKAAKPAGEWNRLVIRCQGPRIEVHLNGVEIQNVNADDYPTAENNLVPLAKRPRKGCIGLQSHGDPVEFRSVSIREL